jgi:hypothetical protein
MQERMWLTLHQRELSYSSRLILPRAPTHANARWLETRSWILGRVTLHELQLLTR